MNRDDKIKAMHDQCLEQLEKQSSDEYERLFWTIRFNCILDVVDDAYELENK